MWILDLDLVCIGWALIGTKIDYKEDVARVVDSEFRGWIKTYRGSRILRYKTMVLGEWVGKGENPGGTRGREAVSASTGDIWAVWGIEMTKGGQRLGLRLK